MRKNLLQTLPVIRKKKKSILTLTILTFRKLQLEFKPPFVAILFERHNPMKMCNTSLLCWRCSWTWMLLLLRLATGGNKCFELLVVCCWMMSCITDLIIHIMHSAGDVRLQVLLQMVTFYPFILTSGIIWLQPHLSWPLGVVTKRAVNGPAFVFPFTRFLIMPF